MQLLKKKLESKEDNQDDSNIYSKDVLETMLEEDALDPVEEAFMRGYYEAV